jgi:hypothetical protein
VVRRHDERFFFLFSRFFSIPTRFVPGDECGFQHSTQYGTAQLSSAQLSSARCMHLRSSVAPNCRPTQAERISASTDSVPCARCAVSRFLFLRIALHCSASHRIASHHFTWHGRSQRCIYTHPGFLVWPRFKGRRTVLTLFRLSSCFPNGFLFAYTTNIIQTR